jgi:hypothetical protein
MALSTPKDLPASRRSKGFTQRDHRRLVEAGAKPGQVVPVGLWHRDGHFGSEAEAQGAFKLAYQQAVDGLGASTAGWMGISQGELDAWLRHGTLPAVREQPPEDPVHADQAGPGAQAGASKA